MQIKHKLINKKWYCYEAQYIILNYTFFLINQTSKNKHPPIKLFTSLNFKINIVYFFIFPFIKSLQMHHWSWLNAWSPGLQGYGNYIRLISPDVLTLRPFLKKNQSTDGESRSTRLPLYNSRKYLNLASDDK